MKLNMRERESMAGLQELESNDTEITLGLGKLMGLFFCLVILCGLSLGVGYTLGRNSARQALALQAAAQPTVPVPAPVVANKPAASQAAPAPQPKAADCTGDDCAPQPAATAPNSTDLTFYQSVQEKNAHPQLAPKPEPATPAPARPSEPHSLGTGYLVQIAAVRNQDDAKLLSDTLHKQKYPVIVAQPGDKLFHVQVGPYADIKEAEAIRTRLIGAGYNAFLKR